MRHASTKAVCNRAIDVLDGLCVSASPGERFELTWMWRFAETRSRGRPAVAMVCLFQIGWRRGDYDAQVRVNRLYRLSMTVPGSVIAGPRQSQTQRIELTCQAEIGRGGSDRRPSRLRSLNPPGYPQFAAAQDRSVEADRASYCRDESQAAVSRAQAGIRRSRIGRR